MSSYAQEKGGDLYTMYKAGSATVSTPAKMALYIVQKFYDDNRNPNQRADLLSALEQGLAHMKGTI